MGTRVETNPSPDDVDPEGPVGTVQARSPSLTVIALGLGLLTVTAWNFLREQRTLSVDLPPLAAAALGLLLSSGLLYAGIRLARSSLDQDERWLVAQSTLGGAAIFAGIITLTMLIRVAEGRAISEAPFVLLTATGGGGIAGSLVGGLYARARRDARVAEYARAEAEQAQERAERAREEAEESREQLAEAQAETERLLEETRETRDDLRLINRVLRHDIKNSIMVIESRAEFLGDDIESATADDIDDRAVEFLETISAQAEEIEREVERTGAVIETITDEDPDLRAMDLGAAIDEQAATIRDSFDVELRVDGLDDGDGPFVRANQVLPDVLGNVLSNAVVHHSGDDPVVEVVVTADGERVTVRIADNGSGIDDDRKSKVFHRGESSGDGGFGLFFVDRMMEQYGGAVRVEDADLGGAAFVFEFQRAE